MTNGAVSSAGGFSLWTVAVLTTAWNLINSQVGTSFVSIPFAVHRTGHVAGIVTLFAAAAASAYSLHLLVRLAVTVFTMMHHQQTDSTALEKSISSDLSVVSYPSFLQHVFGSAGFLVGSVLILLFDFGAMCVFLVSLGDVLPDVFAYICGDQCLLATRPVALLVAFICVSCLSLVREIKSLWLSSLLSDLCALLLVVVFFFASQLPASTVHIQSSLPAAASALAAVPASRIISPLRSLPSDFHWSAQSLGMWIDAASSLSYVFCCHDCVFFMFASLMPLISRARSESDCEARPVAEDASDVVCAAAPSLRMALARWDLCVALSCLTSATVVAAFTSAALSAFGASIAPNALRSLSASSVSPRVVWCAKAALAANMLSVYPLAQFVARDATLRLLDAAARWRRGAGDHDHAWSPFSVSRVAFFAVTAVLCLSSWAIASSAVDVASVVQLCGGLTGLICYSHYPPL
jgi:amino acid permease